MSSEKRTKSDNTKKTKKQKREQQSSSSEDSSNEDMDIDDVQIDFSGFELTPEDHNGILLLLQQLFLKSIVDLTEMTDHLIEDQLDVGSVIKESEVDQETSDNANEEDTVYGLVSVVSLKPKEDLKFVDQLRSMFVGLSKEHATEQTKKYIHSIFNDAKNTVGLILNERYLNLPSSISAVSFKNLKSEIEAESKVNTRFNFTHYILISKLYKIPPKNEKKGGGGDQEFQTTWCNGEEELFDKLADARFEYRVNCDSGLSGKWTEDDEEVLPFRRVLVFKADKLADLLSELSNCT